MLLTTLIYLALAFGGLTALSIMILKIGALLEDCPQSNAKARMAAITITTGFAAIGTGGVILIGALLPMLQDVALNGLFPALGLVALCLGLGFTHAVATLRAVLTERPEVARPDLEPVAKASVEKTPT